MTVFLGIDGGGTGCRAALCDARGRMLGQGQGGAANINTDVDMAAASILQATAAAIGNHDIDPRGLVAVLGLAGGTMLAAVRRLTALLPFAQARIVNDGITAARGALGAGDGVLAAMGTGSVFAVQRGGRIRQVGGRGFLMGDQGSGAVLGRALLARAMRAGDGLAPMTPLLRATLDEFGGIEGIIEFGNRARPGDFARLAPRMLAGDDPAAQDLLAEAQADVLDILTTLRGTDDLPVVFTGGLGPHFAAALSPLLPVRQALGTGLDGALAMAREMGAHPDQPDG
ncbi:BadF/BadG/BcrA/BcrD ATPase family protein [Paracoccus nototheniae]|uniref:BadF/BadG/BcrA/BcrD ATPase family protein n=1 Tax=Paracoccus nototheniae TaxID=2489002 RepID=A0ABW4DXX9_9RHOB|nr:BadF/BadG/BcrA/BcrD ATPase family protein [Paracoccus nototheniae]